MVVARHSGEGEERGGEEKERREGEREGWGGEGGGGRRGGGGGGGGGGEMEGAKLLDHSDGPGWRMSFICTEV